jgi:hypothetical protein
MTASGLSPQVNGLAMGDDAGNLRDESSEQVLDAVPSEHGG